MKRRRRRKRRFPFHLPRRRTVGEFTLSARQMARRRSRMRRSLRQAVMLVLIVVMLVSLSMIISIVSRTVRTRRLNAELAALHDTQPDSTPLLTPDPTQMPEPSPSPEPREALPADMPQDAVMPVPTATPVKAFHRVGGTAQRHMEALYNQNHDLIAWIDIPDVLSLPIMYKDNKYYLTHDFNKNKSSAGTLFLDENHRFAEHTQNLLLHGHNMKDGTMFGRLVQYVHNLGFLRNNAFVHLDTLWEREEYVMFAVLRVSLDARDDRFVNYFSHPTFTHDAAFSAYVRQLQLSSIYAIPIDVSPTDALLTLSTCLDDDRLVIVCRRLREGESRSRLRELLRSSTLQ